MKHQRGSILVGLLWCLTLLSVVVIGLLHSARLQLLVVKNHGDLIQAHYLALAGIEKTKALLFQEAKERKRTAKNHSGSLYDSAQDFRDVPFGRGEFKIFHQGRQDEGGKLMFGVADEESRLNLNYATKEELEKIEGMTPDMAAAIMDWRDKDNTVTPGGAEAEYYASLKPPYLPRNGPFQSVRELLMVKGIPRELFIGEDANQNGLLDPEEDDGKASEPPDNHDGVLDAGWSGLFTVDSLVQNKSASGGDRVDIKSAAEKELTKVKGITADIAKAIVAWRNQNQFNSLADLLDVTALSTPTASSSIANSSRTSTQPRNQRTQGNNTGQNNNSSQAVSVGPKLITDTLLMDIADDISLGSDEQPGPVNINTASAEVLACLPGLDKQLAQAIVSYRQSAGFFPNIAWLLKVDGMNTELFKKVVPRVCARSETFRILSEGRIPSSGARKRIQVVIRFTVTDFKTLSWREDL
ncbi:MAG: comEA protein [Verrucomicrobiales bacterium]|nr:comEA protein [Verrucomicrobiales bacterium]